MYKSIFRYVLIVCAVLAIGQLNYKERALGDYFVSGTKALGMWGITEVAQHPWVAKVLHPKSLSQWFPLGELKEKKQSLVKEARAGLTLPTGASVDNSEENEAEADLFQDEESDSENEDFILKNGDGMNDSAVMEIIR